MHLRDQIWPLCNCCLLGVEPRLAGGGFALCYQQLEGLLSCLAEWMTRVVDIGVFLTDDVQLRIDEVDRALHSHMLGHPLVGSPVRPFLERLPVAFLGSLEQLIVD